MNQYMIGYVDTLEKLNEAKIERITELERENAALRADIHAHEQINKQLIEDKRRLDWLGSQKGQPWLCWDIPLRLTREVIDAERKEAQP